MIEHPKIPTSAMFDILKLGGSLLTDAHWPKRLNEWLEANSVTRSLLIVGGGEMIDAMRRLDAIYSLDQTAMHWRCVRMLRHTADVVSEILSRQADFDVELVTSTRRLIEVCGVDAPANPPLAVVYPDLFYASNLREQVALLENAPQVSFRINSQAVQPAVGWTTTTDAIAVYGAALLGARRCVLLKSCDVDCYSTFEAAAAAGVIDPEAERLTRYYPAVSLVRL